MTRILLTLFVSLASCCLHAQVRHKLINNNSSVFYLQAQNGAVAVTHQIQVAVEYYGANLAADDSIRFAIVNISDSSLLPVISNPLQVIPKNLFSIDKKIASFNLFLTTPAVNALRTPVSFNIKIANATDTANARHSVTVTNVAPNSSVVPGSVKIGYLNPGGDTSVLAPFIKDSEAKEGRQVKIRYKVVGKLSKDSTVVLKLQVPSGSSIKADLVTKSFTVPAGRTSASVDYIDSLYVNFDVSALKDFGADEYIYLSFENNESERDILSFTRRGLVHPNKPFWIEIGANLDLVDGLQPNNFFTGVFFYKRDIKEFRKLFGRRNNNVNNVSVFAGIYESKTSSDSSIGKANQTFTYFDRTAISLIRNDSFPIFRDTGSLRYKTVTKVVSLFFSPAVRLTTGSANSDGLHVFASLWVEMLWARKSVTADGSVLSRKDTFFVPRSQVRGLEDAPQLTSKYFDYRAQYLGVGLPIYMKDNDVNLFINPIFGLSNQRDIAYMQTLSDDPDGNLFLVPKKRWNPFFITQFRLSEEKYGFAFTGEVRGFFLKNAKPQISLALTKKFDLNKFLEFK